MQHREGGASASTAQDRSDLTVLEVARNGTVSAVHAVGTPIFGENFSGLRIEGAELVSLVDADLAASIRQAAARALRSRKLVRFALQTSGQTEDYVVLPQGRDRVLICASDATAVNQQMAHAQFLMSTDATTGLPNAIALNEQLDAVLSTQRVREGRVAVLAVYAGRFDEQCFGLSANEQDKVLCELARRLQRQVRGSNQLDHDDDFERVSIVARSDYRQLTVVLPDIDGGQDAESVADRLVRELSDPIELKRRTVFLSPRIGVALFPQDGRDALSLLTAADAAMEQAREAPEACSVMHSGTVSVRAIQRLDLASELTKALEQERFELRYLPVFDAANRQVQAIEALLRWPDTLLAHQPAQQVLSLAERTGVIVDIGEWVLHTAVTQLAEWQRNLDWPLRLAINLSSQEFASGHLPDLLKRELQSAGLSADQIDLDVREHLVARDLRKGGDGLAALAQTGARLVLEGFGSGHCAFNDIAASPISAIKVAQPFSREGGQTASIACKAAVAAAHELVEHVVGTGIESESQAHAMRDLGCHALQGFLFGRPLDAWSASAMLSRELQEFVS